MATLRPESLLQLLGEGAVVEREPFLLAGLVEEALARKRAGLPIPGDMQFVLDPANWDQTVIVLAGPRAGEESVIVTRDQLVVEHAQSSYRERFEPVGVWIRACCEMRGNSSALPPIFHVDRFVKSVSGFRGWEFKLDDPPSRFVVQKKLDRTDAEVTRDATDELGYVLDCLAVVIGRGIDVCHLYVTPIPRGFPAISYDWAEEMVAEPASEELVRAEAMASSARCHAVARALNQSYCEASKRARLTILWSACEQLLAGEVDRMLSDESVDLVTKSLLTCKELVEDTKSLCKVRHLLADWLKSLGKTTKNDRISQAIADLLGIDTKAARRGVGQAFGLRSSFGHSLSDIDGPQVRV